MTESPPSVAVLLCGDLRHAGRGLDLEAVATSVTEQHPDAQVRIVERLCDNPAETAGTADPRSGRTVLGLCASANLTAEQEAAFREAGSDPLRVDVVDVGRSCAGLPAERGNAKASLLLSASVARASIPESSAPVRLRPRIPNVQGSLGRRSLFTLPVLRYQPIATVDPSRCIHYLGCELCVASCPADALSGNGRQISVDAERCIACGNCLTACPRAATDLAAHSPAQTAATVEALLQTPAPELPGRSIAYVCSAGAGDLDWLNTAEAASSRTVLPVRVPCTGMLSVVWLVAPLLAGAASNYVVECGRACKAGQADRVAAVVDYCQAILALLELPPSAISLIGQENGLPPLDDLPGAGGGLRLSPPADQPLRGLLEAGLPGPAIRALAEACQAPAGLSLPHESSPLGLVAINPETCTGCGNCARACPTDALVVHEEESTTELVFEASRCLACNICLDLCPEIRREAIAVTRTTDIDTLRRGPTTAFKGENAVCEQCGAVIGPTAMIKRIERTLRAGSGLSESAIEMMSRRCNDCTAMAPLTQRSTPGKRPPLLF